LLILDHLRSLDQLRPQMRALGQVRVHGWFGPAPPADRMLPCAMAEALAQAGQVACTLRTTVTLDA
jgi:hypothetical protein